MNNPRSPLAPKRPLSLVGDAADPAVPERVSREERQCDSDAYHQKQALATDLEKALIRIGRRADMSVDSWLAGDHKSLIIGMRATYLMASREAKGLLRRKPQHQNNEAQDMAEYIRLLQVCDDAPIRSLVPSEETHYRKVLGSLAELCDTWIKAFPDLK